MGRLVILIADDDSGDAFFLSRAIADSGRDVRVQTVSDGQEAIDYLAGAGKYSDRRAYPLPDRLLLDIKMPKRSGFEVLEWARSRPEFSLLPVAILSGSELPDDVRRARSLGADYLVKPIEYTGLCGLVKEYLDGRRL